MYYLSLESLHSTYFHRSFIFINLDDRRIGNLITNVLSTFHCPCKSSAAHPKKTYTEWPTTSKASVRKFHIASDLGDGLNFDITIPEITMPRPELKIPMAPDAKFE